MANRSATCMKCGHHYELDPQLAVPCPECGAKAGSFCRRPSEHSGPMVNTHAIRDLLALALGKYDCGCPPFPEEILRLCTKCGIDYAKLEACGAPPLNSLLIMHGQPATMAASEKNKPKEERGWQICLFTNSE